MIPLILGCAAFALYFLYDINSISRQYRLPRGFFAAGTVLLCVSTLMDLRAALLAGAISSALDYALLIAAALCFAALIYCLFFALPFQETYTKKNSLRPVYSGGVYGLCRHPGVLCFFAMELLLGLAALPGAMLVRGMVFSALNVLYAYFQDRVSFPKTFCDYSDYRKKVPFLIPVGQTPRRDGKTALGADKEEVEV